MRTYRSRSSIIWGLLTVAVGASLAVTQFVATDRADAGVGPALGLALAGAGVTVFLLPSIRIGADGLEVHNVLQVVTVPFARLEAVESLWTLELAGDDGRKVGVMASPARSRRERHRPEHTTTSGAAAAVQQGWDQWRERGGKPVSPREAKQSPAFTRQPHLAGIACVAISVTAAAVAFLF